MGIEFDQPPTELHFVRAWNLPQPLKENDSEDYGRRGMTLVKRVGLTPIIDRAFVQPYPEKGLALWIPLSQSGLTGYTWVDEDYSDLFLHLCVQDFDLSGLPNAVKDIFETDHVLVDKALSIPGGKIILPDHPTSSLVAYTSQLVP